MSTFECSDNHLLLQDFTPVVCWYWQIRWKTQVCTLQPLTPIPCNAIMCKISVGCRLLLILPHNQRFMLFEEMLLGAKTLPVNAASHYFVNLFAIFYLEHAIRRSWNLCTISRYSHNDCIQYPVLLTGCNKEQHFTSLQNEAINSFKTFHVPGCDFQSSFIRSPYVELFFVCSKLRMDMWATVQSKVPWLCLESSSKCQFHYLLIPTKKYSTLVSRDQL